MSCIASNVDSVVENIEQEIEQNANVCNITKSIDIKPTKDARQKNRIYSKCDALANRVVISFFYDRHKILFKTIAIDTPGGNLNFVRNIKAQTTALNRAIT